MSPVKGEVTDLRFDWTRPSFAARESAVHGSMGAQLYPVTLLDLAGFPQADVAVPNPQLASRPGDQYRFRF